MLIGKKSNGSVPIVDVMDTTKPHARNDYFWIYFGLGLICNVLIILCDFIFWTWFDIEIYVLLLCY